MKNLNLIKRLWTDSHEKQSPQRFGRYAAMLIMLLTLGVGQMWAATSTTLYYAISSSDVGSYTVKYNVKLQGDKDNWKQGTMSKQSGTYNGKYIYKATFTDSYDGLATIQFQLYDGSTWKSQVVPFENTWTGQATYNGKLWEKGSSGWKAYATDHTISNGATIVWDNAGNTGWSNTYLYKEVNGGSGSNSSAFTRCGSTTQWYKTYASAETKIGKLQFRANTSNWNDGTHTTDLISAGDLSGVTLFTYMNTKDGYALNWQVTTNAKKATSGTKIYFDNTDAWSGEIWLKYGTSTYNRSSAARATQVTGTANLYVITIPNDCYFEKYYLASSYGWTDYNPINDTHVGNRIEYQASNLTSDITYVATGSTSGSSPTVYATTTLSGHTRRLTFGSHTNGNITVRYTDESGVEQTVSSASADHVDVAQTCQVIITAVPNSGYAPSTLTLGGVGITSGAQQIIRAAGTIEATFVAEETHDVTVSYKYGTRSLRDAQTFEVGVTTASDISAEVIDGFTFSSWSNLTNVTNNSANLTTNPININTIVSGSDGSMTCNYTPWTCSLDIVPSEGATGHSSRTAMSYDATEKAYYINRTTASSTERYRFYIDSKEYSTSGNTELVIAGTKVAANTPVQGYGSNKPSVYFNDGGTGSNITVWFDYENKKAWVTEQKHTVTISAGANGTVSPTSVSVGNVVKSGSITATPSSHYHLSSWTIPSGVTLVDGSTTTSPITIKATADDKEVTASFAGDQYKITYKDQGGGAFSGSQTTPPTSHTYGTATTLKIPTKSGYTFGGWFTSIDCTTGAIGNTSSALLGATAFTANITLYAKWTENMTTVNLVASPTGKGTFTCGETVTSISAGVATKPTVTAVPGTGYHLAGTIWSESSDYISLSSTTTASTTISATGATGQSADLTATFTPNTYQVQFHRNGASESTVYQDFTYDVAQNLTANTYTRTGYNFSGWSTTKARADAGTVDYADEANVSNLTSVNSATFHLYASWNAKSYTVTLDLDEANKGTIAGADGSASVTFDAAPSTIANRPTAANGYALDGYYTDHDGEGLKVINGDGTWIASVTGYTDGDQKWKHDGDVTLYAYYKKAEITNLVAAPGVIAPGETITITPTIEPTPTGTTKVCWEVQYSNGTALPSQPTFTPVAGNAVSFPVPSASATYIIQAKLAKGSTCPANLADVLSTRTTTFQVAGAHTVTIRYQDSDGRTLQAPASIEASPLNWTTDGDITPPTITGYTFARWDAGDGVTIKNGNSDPVTTTTTSSIQIKAVYDGTLTAVYNKKNMIFFNNTLGWEDVYVYFYNTDKYWSSTYGSGANKYQGFGDGESEHPYWEEEHGHMTQIEGTNIWYFDYTEAGYTTRLNVAFTEGNQHNYQWFNKTNAVRRGDHISELQMFVPLTTKTNELNSTKYYNSGYWMNYPENTGYSLLIYNQKAKDGATKLYEIPFEFTEDFTMPMELVVDLEAGKTYGFEIKRADGKYYSNTETMTTNTTNKSMRENQSSYCGLQTTAAGNYTFRFYYSSSDYRMDVTYPVAANDYRIVYTDAATWSKDAHTASWSHPSRVITKNSSATETKKDTVSFFWSYGSSPAIKYQKCTGTGTGSVTWDAGTSIDVSSFSSVLTTTGVYNFIFEQSAGGASISLVGVEPYIGNYYIRTDCAGSTKWANFSSMDHQMTYSDYAEVNSGYSHYYTHWVTSGTNVKFCIANDYSMCITDTLVEDKGTVIANITAEGNDGAGRLNSASANIRFMWDQATNKISRAYIGGSTYISDRFLVLEGNEKMYDQDGSALNISGLNSNEANLIDVQNFVYERTIQVNTKARAKLTAKYNNNIQYFKGSEGTFAEGTTIELLGGDAIGKHTMRIVYDFKTNRLVTAYVPSGTINADIAINADLMIVREHQGAGQQLLFEGAGKLSKVHTVYGVMRFNRWTLNNKEKTGVHSPVGDPKSIYERSLYWISFPFNVKLSDVFGFGTYGVDWIIEYYDGAERATNGYWIDSEGFWKMVMPAQRANFTLEAGKGYVLAIDVDAMKDNNTTFWANNIEQVELFFPSATNVENITQTTAHTIVPEHECTIDRRTDKSVYDTNKDRTKADSHWNMIGVPSYANYGATLTSDEAGTQTITWNSDPYTNNLPFLYEWNMTDDSYTVQSGSTYLFKAMHAYMVQYHGDLYWSLASATPTPSPIVARRAYAEKPQNAEFRLELQQNEKMVDQTFVNMKDAEEISAGFKFDEDLCKEFNAGKANIYTLIENYLPAAGNTLPMSEQTTLVPVGVKTTAAGEYTFAMPEGTNGVSVVLIDNIAGTRTNLALSDYTVALGKGDLSDRFMLEIAPIKQMPTDIENVQGDNVHSTKVRKVMIDGILYIVKDGKVFDARGAKVK